MWLMKIFELISDLNLENLFDLFDLFDLFE